MVQSLCDDARAPANDKLCRLLFFIGTLKDAGAARVTACIPYLAYARKDRRTQRRDIGALFEAVGADRILVLDVHNEAAFDNAFRCEPIRIEVGASFADHLALSDATSRIVVASPDTGGIKRAQRLREVLERKAGRAMRDALKIYLEVPGCADGQAAVQGLVVIVKARVAEKPVEPRCR